MKNNTHSDRDDVLVVNSILVQIHSVLYLFIYLFLFSYIYIEQYRSNGQNQNQAKKKRKRKQIRKKEKGPWMNETTRPMKREDFNSYLLILANIKQVSVSTSNALSIYYCKKSFRLYSSSNSRTIGLLSGCPIQSSPVQFSYSSPVSS